jgi:hypothetical protein
MTHSTSREKPHPLIYFIIIVLPFLIFYWMFPFYTELTIGNDYVRLPIHNQMELFFSIKTGSFPLYAPGYAWGTSASALTLGQIFHPISYIASIIPGYWDGNALQCNTLVRLFTIGITHLALFAFLRKIRLNTILSFFLSCITVYNLRMLDLFRYGASLEAWTSYLLLCIAVGWYFVQPTRWLGPLSIIGSTYLLVCSGHPQMVYYAVLGAGLFSLVVPFFLSSMLPDLRSDFKDVLTFWFKIGLYFGLGVLLTSAYIVPFYFDFVAMNVKRMGSSYAWADSNLDTFIGTLNNFFIPLLSDVHGAFGSSYLIIMAAVLPVLKCFRVRVPRIIWVIWVLMVFVFLYMQGSRTPVHWLFWKYFPFASSFRIAGRVSIIMPVLIMMLLAWVLKAEAFPMRLKGTSVMIVPSRLLAVVALLITSVYLSALTVIYLLDISLVKAMIGPLTPVLIHNTPFFLWIVIAIILSGIGSLILMAFYNKSTNAARVVGIALCLIMCAQLVVLMRYGTWVWTNNRYKISTYEQMKEEKKVKLDYRYNPGFGLSSSVVVNQVNRSFVEPYLGKIFTQVIPVSSQDEAYTMMERNRSPRQIFVEGYINDNDSSISSQELNESKGIVDLVYSSFNRLQFRVYSPVSAFFGLSYPNTGHWRAWLNDRKTYIYRANGAAHAVQIPKGESLLEFRYYSPAAFWGMIISCATFTLIGLYVFSGALRGLTRVLALTLVPVLGAGVFMFWYSSLYAGENLGTEYTWTSPPLSPAPNLAYGKKTWENPAQFRTIFQSSRTVDGDRSPKSGFKTNYHRHPSWTIDLYKTETLRKIVIYESVNEPLANIRPLTLDFSLDGKQWYTAASVTSDIDPLGPVDIVFEKQHKARYIRIRVSDEVGYLALDEVEIYGVKSSE